jgi:hypothetical protein
MKNLLKPILLLAIALPLLQSCEDKCTQTVTYTVATPIFMQPSEFRLPVASEAPRDLKDPGKIYFYGKYILINERNEGIHIIDNGDPNAPSRVSFVPVEGSSELAVRNNVLYTNGYMDLLSIDISNPLDVKLLSRKEDVLPYGYGNGYYDPAMGYLVDFEWNDVTEELDCGSPFWGGGVFWAEDFAVGMASVSAPTQAVSTGVGGSMARFTLYDKYLYVVDDSQLNVYSLANADCPELASEVPVAWGIETIFPYQDKLFIGGNAGMYIFDNSNPEQPVQLSQFQHARACDPVFVKDNYAYVTLRNGTECESFSNELDLVDISDILNPVLVERFPMSNPHGLTIKDNDLFVCEGAFGLKGFDISAPATLDQRQRSHLTGFDAYDVIANPGEADHLFLIGKDGFYQFDFTDPNNVVQMSKMAIQP